MLLPMFSFREVNINHVYGQVFWLPDHSSNSLLPVNHDYRDGTVGSVRVVSPVTAAGPRRIRTVFPFHPHS